ncbi:hypothetical protein ACFFSY_29450 [Paenibacillus aurantiacus]|uniref:Uncharacterized protein n=1 Tax=Paenibacillus aurantiacus TaxID=1936118 RepID=A0ABV5KXY4_9BACL
MYETSQKFKAGIYAPYRATTGRVTFDISDVTAASDVTSITTSGEAAISNKQQLINKKRTTSSRLATLETDRFKLDGTFTFADDTIANNGEMGFCSSVLSGANGTFVSFPTLTFNFGTTHSSLGLTITFDAEEYATDFTVAAYAADNSVIATVNVTGNTDTLCTPIGQLYNYKKIIITIKKWCRSDRRARVLEVDFGVVRVYTDDNLVSMGLVEQIDLTSGEMPSPEFTFTVDNSSREFNILNPTGFYKYLQERQQVIAEIGLDIGNGNYEYVPIGNYLLAEWRSDEGSMTATFTARTNLDTMAETEHENLSPRAGYNLYQMAVDMFALCGVTNYDIDTALQDVGTLGLVERASCRDILQMIAIAGRAVVWVTRENVLTIRRLGAMGTSVDAIALDNQYNEAQIKLEKATGQVVVSYWTNLDTSTDVTVAAPIKGDTLKLDGNTLINTAGQAEAVANWILAQRGYRAAYQSNWRGNPAHELGDVITIENTYGADMKVFITKNEINYAGYLSAKTEARGAVN